MSSNKLYKHYKNGNLYRIICIAKYTENLDAMIVYQNVSNGETWVRSVWEFNEIVHDGNGKSVRRFTEVGEENEV